MRLNVELDRLGVATALVVEVGDVVVGLGREQQPGDNQEENGFRRGMERRLLSTRVGSDGRFEITAIPAAPVGMALPGMKAEYPTPASHDVTWLALHRDEADAGSCGEYTSMAIDDSDTVWIAYRCTISDGDGGVGCSGGRRGRGCALFGLPVPIRLCKVTPCPLGPTTRLLLTP